LITTLAQRWRERRDSYRPAGEVIRTGDFEVAALGSDSLARAFVERHHYSASYPAARFRFGLLERGEFVGVAVFSHPSNDRTLTKVFPGSATDSVELGRFVLLDRVPGNGETWFLARCFEQLRREGLRGVVSFSDPVARTTAAGAVIFGGHVGTIYQAHNAVYLGRGRPATLRLLADGRLLAPRALSKLRNLERGWRYIAGQLIAAGASAQGIGTDPRAWLERELPRVARGIRHPGNHKYAWALQRSARRDLERLPTLPYPKFQRAA